MRFLMVLSRARRQVNRARRYISRFAFADGLRLYRQLSGDKQSEVAVHLPSLRLPLIVRQGTSDVPTFEQIFVDEEYAIPLKASPKLIVDLGANVGYASVFFANRYPKAKIIAIEPERTNAAVLRKNTIGYPNVEIIEAGIWNRKAYLKIDNPQDEKWAIRLTETDASQGAVKAITMFDVMEFAGCDFVDLLKIDIEGAEAELFSSDCGWLDKVGAIAIEFHERLKPGSSEPFKAAISKRSFGRSSLGEKMVFVQEPRGIL